MVKKEPPSSDDIEVGDIVEHMFSFDNVQLPPTPVYTGVRVDACWWVSKIQPICAKSNETKDGRGLRQRSTATPRQQ